jgi:hypothetical protein
LDRLATSAREFPQKGDAIRLYTDGVNLRNRFVARWISFFAAVVLFVLGIDCARQGPAESRSERPRDSARSESPSAVSSGERYDLSRDEERGGHTLRKHVGRTDDELRERLDRERDISAASTWTDLAAAEETVAAAARANQNKIESWERRGDRRPNLALHFDAGRVIGRSLIRGADQVVPCTQAVVVLRAEGEGFYILTTYPEARE